MATKPENFTLAEPMKNRQIDWIFPDLWEARTAGMIAGDSGLGKTHFVMQLLHAIAQGEPIPSTPFFCAKPRPVVYISQEDEGQFLRDEFFIQNPALRKNKGACERIRIVSTYRQGPTRDAWATACKDSGLVAGRAGVTPHDLRRCAARNLSRAGVPEQIAMRITGHKTASMYRRYRIVDERDLREATHSLNAYLETQPTTTVVAPIKKAAGE